jgi:hypothetical protein
VPAYKHEALWSNPSPSEKKEIHIFIFLIDVLDFSQVPSTLISTEDSNMSIKKG